MKIILYVLLGFSLILSSTSRLIENATDRTPTTEPMTGSSVLPKVRLARNIKHATVEYEFGLLSKEDQNDYSAERLRFESMIQPMSRLSRKARSSSEHVDKTAKNMTSPAPTTSTPHVRPKPKSSLIKKPIPKYNEMDYDEDFQMKIRKSPMKIVDSGEHEDEDFNLNDYEFDLTHDEFIGRGQPLEPRVKNKDTHETESTKPEAKHHDNMFKSKSNGVHRGSPKKGRSAVLPLREKEDYYDESSSKVPEKARDMNEELNEENVESKEYGSKIGKSRRVTRSYRELNV